VSKDGNGLPLFMNMFVQMAIGNQRLVTNRWLYYLRREGSRNKDPLKYLKDALILEQGLLDEPNNERYVFYLAQSYRDNVKHKLAIKYYIKRAEMGGWFEERYISYLEAGRLTLMCNPTKVAKALQYFIRAIDVNPKRLEAPYYLVRTARLK